MLFIGMLSLSLTQSHAALFERAKFEKAQLDKAVFDKALLPQEARVPGGIALLPFTHTEKTPPKVSFMNNRVLVQKVGKNEWVAVIGLPLKLQAGKYVALIEGENIEGKLVDGKNTNGENENIELSFEIVDKEYEAQYITLKDDKKVSPPKEALERIAKETRTMKDIFASWSDKAPTSLTMQLPATGPLSSQFGLKRFFNNQARNPHSGLDIAAEHGSEIWAPLDGRIAATGDYYFNGNTVLIDHGQGMVSMYCHLDSIDVQEGQLVKTGELLGKVGSTGRATGPHLHWSMNLNNTRVDPLLFLQTKPQHK